MRRTQIAVFVHLVWATWDRLPLLTRDVRDPIYRAIGAKCQELKVDVLAIGGIEDHIHLLVQLPATIAVADLVKHVKGATSHLTNYQLPGGGSFRWQGSYAAFSVDPRNLKEVCDYIVQQEQRHATDRLFLEWEHNDNNN